MIQSRVLYKFLAAQSAALPEATGYFPRLTLARPADGAFQAGSGVLLRQLESMLKRESLGSVEKYFDQLNLWLNSQDDTTQACFVEAMSLMCAEPGQEPRPDQVLHSGIMYAQRILIDLVTLAATQPEGGLDLPPVDRLTGITVVLTAHPSQARNPLHLLLYGQLEALTLGQEPHAIPRQLPHSRSATDLKQFTPGSAGDIFTELWSKSPYIFTPSVADEVATATAYSDVEARGIRLLEQANQLLPGQLPVHKGTWAGTEADRNCVTPWVQLHSLVQYSRNVSHFYEQQLREIESFIRAHGETFAWFGPTAILHIDNIIQLIGAHNANLVTIYGTAQSMAAVEVFDLFVLQGIPPEKFPDHVKHNIKQLFPADFSSDLKVRLRQICTFVWMKRPEEESDSRYTSALSTRINEVVKARLEGKTEPTVCAEDRILLNALLTTKQALYASRIQEKLKRTYQLFKTDMRRLKTDVLKYLSNLREESADAVSDAEDFVSTTIDGILSRYLRDEFHGREAQWRLDSEQLKKAFEGLMESQDRTRTTPFRSLPAQQQCETILNLIMNPTSDKIDVDHIVEPTQRHVVDYFRVQSWAQQADPKHAPILIIANAHTASDFIYAFYLAVKTGQIKVENGQVVGQPLVWIMPLLESVKDHDEGAEMFKQLLSIPLFRSYFEAMKQLGYMKAYSDTARDDGTIGAMDRLARTPHYMHQVSDNAFVYDTTGLEALAPLGILTGDADIRALWTLILDGATEDEIRRKWEAVVHTPLKRRGSETPAPAWREEHGVGSVYHRFGGSGTDPVFRRLLARFELYNSLVTLQPGLLEQYYMSPKRAAGYLAEQLRNSAVKEVSVDDQTQPFDLEFFQLLKAFVDPSIEAYARLVKSKDGLLNQWLVNNPSNPLAYIVINTMAIGSRGKPPQDLQHDLKKGLVEENRAITVSAILERTGFKFNVVGPFVEMIRANTVPMETLQRWYREKPLFQLLIHKVEEGYLRSSLIDLKIMLGESGAALYEECEQYHVQGLAYLAQITGRSAMENLPKIAAEVRLENWVRSKFVANYTAMVQAAGSRMFMTKTGLPSGPQEHWSEAGFDSEEAYLRNVMRIILAQAGPLFGYG